MLLTACAWRLTASAVAHPGALQLLVAAGAEALVLQSL
jgi:hypothetical protein